MIKKPARGCRGCLGRMKKGRNTRREELLVQEGRKQLGTSKETDDAQGKAEGG